METLDLHNKRHSEVERLVEDFLALVEDLFGHEFTKFVVVSTFWSYLAPSTFEN